MNSEPLSESMPQMGKGNWRQVLDGFADPDGRLVGDRSVDGPAGGDVRHGQGEAELPEEVPTFVADQVDLDEAGNHVVPLRPGADGDLGLEEGSRLGVAHPPEPGQYFGPR